MSTIVLCQLPARLPVPASPCLCQLPRCCQVEFVTSDSINCLLTKKLPSGHTVPPPVSRTHRSRSVSVSSGIPATVIEADEEENLTTPVASLTLASVAGPPLPPLPSFPSTSTLTTLPSSVSLTSPDRPQARISRTLSPTPQPTPKPSPKLIFSDSLSDYFPSSPIPANTMSSTTSAD